MWKKIRPGRRKAFLKALGETGNQTLAAEHARVSRSWVAKWRALDPAFDGEVRAAIAEARRRLGARGDRRPPKGWGFLDGEELVVRGSNGRRVQIARARLHQWTPRVENRFLAVLQATCNVEAACAAAGMWRASAYGHRERWPGFARRWDEAEKAGSIHLEFGLLENFGNIFSDPELPPPAELPPLPTGEALHNLYMHQHKVDGRGRRPGLPQRQPGFEEAVRVITSKIEMVERASAVPEAEQERLRREWARRRGSPSGGSG